MVLSTRVSLQWLPNEPEELTSTLVFTTPQDHFVDVRIYNEQYPHIQKGSTPEAFDKIFQWVITGEEEEIPDTNKIRFRHEVNLQEVMKSLESGRPLSECRSEPDIGAFWSIEGSEDRKETGSMVNPETGKHTDYVEIWRSLDPALTTPVTEIREISGKEHEVLTLELKHNGVLGRIIRLGNWVQGVIYEEAEKTHPISVLRCFYDSNAGEWKDLIRYGKHSFPELFKELEEDGLWKKIE